MEPMSSNVNDLKFTFNGKVYGLHHSGADLTPGKDKLLPSGALSTAQSTAVDTTKGFSYFWDAANIDSVTASVHNQANLRNIYLVEAASAGDVLPDINVPGSPARAIKGEMSILDKISLPANIGDGREARISVLEMLKKHGISPEGKASGQLIDDAYFINRGERALAEYIPARAQMKVDTMVNMAQAIDPKTGMVSPAFREGGYGHDRYLASLTESGRKGMLDEKIAEGEKVLKDAEIKAFNRARTGGFMSPANNNINLNQINVDSLKKYADLEKGHRVGVTTFGVDSVGASTKEEIVARIRSNRSRLAAQESAGKGFKKAMAEPIQQGVVPFRRSRATRVLSKASANVSSHVASGKGGSGMLRNAGAALRLLRKKF